MSALRTGSTLKAVSYSFALMIGGSSFADAGVASALPSRTVRFSDLDLATNDGVKTLYARIRSAARAVCGESESPNSLMPSVSWKACVTTSIRSALADAERAPLTRYYGEHERYFTSDLRTAPDAR